MSAPFVPQLPAVDNAAVVARVVPIIGDGMEPTLRRGDFAIAVPAHAFTYDAMYVLEVLPGSLEVLRCQHVGKRQIRILKDNPAYTSVNVLPVEEFNAMVVGQVAAITKMVDAPLLNLRPGNGG